MNFMLSRKLKIILCCAAAALLVLGAGFVFWTADRNDQDHLARETVPARVGNLSATSSDLASMPSSRDVQSEPADDALAARARMEDLKNKLRADHADFGRMKRELEDRLSRAPNGKITPEEVLAVIPPRHREAFKSVIAGMDAEQNEPMTMKETRP